MKERRINLRFNADTYDKLDRKRFEERTTFQAVGERFFLQWLKGESGPASPFGAITRDEERLLRAMLRYSREAPASDLLKQAIPALIRLWGPK